MSEQPRRSIYGDADAGAGGAPGPIGVMGQISGVFQEPAKLFSRLAERPQWVGALVLQTVLVLVFTTAWLMGVDAREFVTIQLESVAAQIPSDQLEQVIETNTRLMPVGGILGVLFGTPLFTFLLGAVYWAVGLGAMEDPEWRPSYWHGLVVAAVPALATIPYSLLGTLMALVQPVGTPRPDQMVPSSLGYWVEAESPKLSMLYSSLDLFMLFQYVAVFFAAKYAMRAKTWGAALCVAVALLGPAVRILFAK
jgi:hypothetical protein